MRKLYLLILFCGFGLFGFSQYNDTLYYKSGFVRSCEIKKHDEKFVTYEYRNKKGNLVDNKIPTSKLTHYVIYNEMGKQVYHSRFPNRKHIETKEEEEE